MAERVAVTGAGVVTPIGVGVEAFGQALRAGCSGVGRITAFDCTGFDTRIAAAVPDGFDGAAWVEPPLFTTGVRRAQVHKVEFLTLDREGAQDGLGRAAFKEEFLGGGHRGKVVEGVVAQDRRGLTGIVKNDRRCAWIETAACVSPIAAHRDHGSPRREAATRLREAVSHIDRSGRGCQAAACQGQVRCLESHGARADVGGTLDLGADSATTPAPAVMVPASVAV